MSKFILLIFLTTKIEKKSTKWCGIHSKWLDPSDMRSDPLLSSISIPQSCTHTNIIQQILYKGWICICLINHLKSPLIRWDAKSDTSH